MSERHTLVPASIAATAGVVLWIAASLLTGKREAWDASEYWSIVYPLALLACAWLGYAYPVRPWRWPLVLFESQFVAMWLRDTEVGSLWPLGMALFAVLAIPGVFAARFASRYSSAQEEADS